MVERLVAQCAWCKRIRPDGHDAIGPPKPLSAGDTHGICPECKALVLKNIERMRRRDESNALRVA